VVFAETCVCLIIHSILDLADFTLVEFMPRMKKVIFYSAYLASHEFKIGKKSSNREFNGPKGVQTDIGAKNGFNGVRERPNFTFTHADTYYNLVPEDSLFYQQQNLLLLKS
jgi:hypothetical protein